MTSGFIKGLCTMPDCTFCAGNRDRCVCAITAHLIPANDNAIYDPLFISLQREQIRSPAAMVRLAIAYLALGYSRRTLLNFVSSALLLDYEGIIVWNGKRVLFGDPDVNEDEKDIDVIFRTDIDDSERYLSRFLSYAKKPPKQRARKDTTERLMTLWTALAVRHRRIAELVIL
jgi:hypothetical protein